MYIEQVSQKIIRVLKEHMKEQELPSALWGISCNYGSPYPDCDASIFFTATDGKRWTIGVKSRITGNKIVEKVKEHFKSKKAS